MQRTHSAFAERIPMTKQKYYIVSADALPEVFLKVAEAKRMLHC